MANWIQDAIKKPGALKAAAKKAGKVSKKTGKIEKSFIDKEAKSGSPLMKKRATLAKTLSKMRKK